MSASKRRKKLSFDSSTEEDTDSGKTPQQAGKYSQENTCRSSERINRRQSRNFEMPSRQDVWNKILPTKSPDKYYHLKPRKLINNYTKENNSYNYDPIYTSGSESMEDFIEDDITYRRKNKKKKTVHRIKHRHSRVIHKSSDSESSHTNESADRDVGGIRVSHGDDLGERIGTDNRNSGESGSQTKENESGIFEWNRNKETDDEDANLACRKVRKKSNRLESDDESSDTVDTAITDMFKDPGIAKTDKVDSETDHKHSVAEREIEKPNQVKDSSETVGSDNDSNFGVNFHKSKTKRSNILDSDSESDNKPENDDNTHNKNNVRQESTSGNTVNVENEDNTADNESEEEVIIINDVNAVLGYSGDESNDSFIVDGDGDEASDDADDEEVLSNGDETSDEDSDSDTVDDSVNCQRKKRVRVKMIQKKKDRDQVLDQIKAARERRKSREGGRASNE